MKRELRRKYHRQLGKKGEEDAWREFKMIKNRMKHIKKKNREKKKKREARQLERLGTKNPEELWGRLKSMNPDRKKGIKTRIVSAIAENEGAEEVFGEMILAVWKDVYERLGKANPEDGVEFDREWKVEVEAWVREKEKEHERCRVKGEEEEEKMEPWDMTDIREWNRGIELYEVNEVIGELKTGKACGTDEIYNEILIHGGSLAEELVWELCKKCWERERKYLRNGRKLYCSHYIRVGTIGYRRTIDVYHY